MTPPDGLRRASILLEHWAVGNGKNDETLNEAFAEICAVYDTLVDTLHKRPQFAKVLLERERAALGFSEIATEQEIQLSLKEWAHSAIDCGANLEQLRLAFLCVAASFYRDIDSTAFAAQASFVHSLQTEKGDSSS